VWVQAAIVSAGLEGAKLFAKDKERAASYLGVAQLAFDRLTTYYRTGGYLLLTGKKRSGRAGLDDYADTVTYNGLAAFILQYGADIASQIPRQEPAATLAQTGSMRSVDNNATGLSVSRRNNIWLAVHKQKTHPTDLRWDFGLLSLKAFTRYGWKNMLPPAPLTTDRHDSQGPMLITDRRQGLPYGYSIDSSPDGTILVRGDYRDTNGNVLRHGVNWEYTPHQDTLLLTTQTQPGDRLQMLFYSEKDIQVNERTLRTATLDISFSAPIRVKTSRGLSSSLFEEMTQAKVTIQPDGTTPLTVTYKVHHSG
jgi:hypothetical protein